MSRIGQDGKRPVFQRFGRLGLKGKLTGRDKRQLYSVIIGFLAWESTSVKTWGNSLAAGISTGICYRELLSSEPPTALST